MEFKPEGYLFLIVSWSIIIVLMIYCYKKVLFDKKDEPK